MDKNYEKRKNNLKIIRDKFLRFHKILMDWDREDYERNVGKVTPGKFLELLLSDERFVWLRTVSMLIVRIDESFALSDGMSNEMLDGFYTEIGDMFDDKSDEYLQFKEKLQLALPNLPEAKKLNDEIIEILS